MTMTSDDVLAEFRAAGALREGHFVLSSGLHSPVFLQKARVFMFPDKTERLCRALAAKVRAAGLGPIDFVISPAVGGIVLFASAGFFVLVMLFTLLGKEGTETAKIEWAESLSMPPGGYKPGLWDRLGLWFGVAVVLVVIAYAIPLWDLFHLTRYGSPGFKPF